jgi:hypothetical protein
MWSMAFLSADIQIERLIRFIREASVQLNADFACVTLLTPEEVQNGRANGTVRSLDSKGTQFMFGIFSQHLQRCIPDVYWITVFGKAYVEMLGKETLLGTPAFRSETLGDTAVFLQLTPTLDDLRVNAKEFEDRKERIKKWLGAEVFFDATRTEECRRPNFIWK